MTLTAGDRQFLEHVDVVDPNFFNLIQLPLVAGDPDTVFRQPESVVLSQVGGAKIFRRRRSHRARLIVDRPRQLRATATLPASAT